jgi:flavin-binding protein dodecin
MKTEPYEKEAGQYDDWFPVNMMYGNTKESNIHGKGGVAMESIYKIIAVVGTSKNSWEDAAKNAVETAGKSLEDLRVAEVDKLDMAIDKNKVVAYRARVNISFKYRVE